MSQHSEMRLCEIWFVARTIFFCLALAGCEQLPQLHLPQSTPQIVFDSAPIADPVLSAPVRVSRGPEENEDLAVAKPLQCSGRLMLLFRLLAHNTDEARIARLRLSFHRDLSEGDPSFRWGVIGTTLVPVRFRELPGNPGQQLGSQLMLSFWAWGDSEADTMLNLGRVFKNLSRALRKVSASA